MVDQFDSMSQYMVLHFPSPRDKPCPNVLFSSLSSCAVFEGFTSIQIFTQFPLWLKENKWNANRIRKVHQNVFIYSEVFPLKILFCLESTETSNRDTSIYISTWQPRHDLPGNLFSNFSSFYMSCSDILSNFCWSAISR